MHLPFQLLNVFENGHLYLDPGSGSFLLQLLLAALLGAGFAIRIFWKKIKAFFTGKKVEEKPDVEETSTTPEQSTSVEQGSGDDKQQP
jgi:hypothetical protein